MRRKSRLGLLKKRKEESKKKNARLRKKRDLSRKV